MYRISIVIERWREKLFNSYWIGFFIFWGGLYIFILITCSISLFNDQILQFLRGNGRHIFESMDFSLLFFFPVIMLFSGGIWAVSHVSIVLTAKKKIGRVPIKSIIIQKYGRREIKKWLSLLIFTLFLTILSLVTSIIKSSPTFFIIFPLLYFLFFISWFKLNKYVINTLLSIIRNKGNESKRMPNALPTITAKQ